MFLKAIKVTIEENFAELWRNYVKKYNWKHQSATSEEKQNVTTNFSRCENFRFKTLNAVNV